MNKIIMSVVCLLIITSQLKAQTGTYSTLNFPNNYTNTITTVLATANFRSGFIYQSNGSINFGLTGLKQNNFRFRWLAHDMGAIDYTTDTDQLMFLDGYGNLRVKGDVTSSGNIGVGTTDTKGYKLAVAGNMIAEKIKVKLQSSWPDYVFSDQYQLPPLQEVEQFVKTNRHLPDMPAAEDVKKEGMDVEEMNRKLLEKVEELMLYVIDLQKENASLKQQNQEQFSNLLSRIKKLEAAK